MAVPGTSIAGHIQSGGDIDNYRYSAPEIQWPEDHGTDDILITKESDVYGMGMVVYEVSSNFPVSSSPTAESRLDPPGLDWKHTVWQTQRRSHVISDTGRGNSPKTLRRDGWYCLGIP